MKKSILSAAITMVLAGLFLTGCASTGAKAGGAEVKSVHPREYTLDLAENQRGSVITVVYNQYGPNYQSDPAMDFTKAIKKDKPQAGDVIHVNYKFSADLDLPRVKFSLIDPTVNYWLELSPDDTIVIDDVKAGEIYEGSQDITLTANVSGEFKVYIAYDNKEFLEEGLPKVDQPSNFTLYDIEDVVTTDTVAELAATGAEIPTGPKTIKIEIAKIAAFCDIVTGHPWVNGQQIMSEIENYQADISYMSILEDAPEAGDILEVTWKGKPSQDIAALKMMPVDHSASVGWWNVLINDESEENVVVARDLKGGEVFEITKTFVLDKSAESKDVILRVWYDYDAETNGPGPCTIIGQK